MIVYIVFKRESEEYNGSSDTIVAVYKNSKDAERITKDLNEKEGNSRGLINVEFYYLGHLVIE